MGILNIIAYSRFKFGTCSVITIVKAWSWEKKLMKILVVDDNPNDAELVKYALKPDFPQAEFTIVTEEKDFQPMVDKDEYSLVLTDYFLGWTDGFTIFRNIH
ncbi:MAG: response regulator transcription factor, partial [Actinomycetia bacterium]|nr:response regulator transcription factor [Actinomycetes bacterium]